MVLSVALSLIATLGGALATYLYDEGASLATRLCTGACIGLAAFGLIGFVLACLMGLTPLSIALATVFVALPFLLLFSEARREEIQAECSAAASAIRRAISNPTGPGGGYVLYYSVAAVMMWLIFDRAMIDKPEGIYTGVLNNFGDLPFHLSVVTRFAFGHNYPPEDPTYAGVRFTYPFLTDFISAIFVRCGADLRASLFIENLFLAVSFVGVLHRWAWELLRDRVAALLTPLLVLLNGGFGWALLLTAAANNDEGLLGVLKHLPASFTVIPQTTWRWGNAISSLLLPQRGILLGLPLAVIVFTQWWLASGDREQGRKGEVETGSRRDKGRHGHSEKNTTTSKRKDKRKHDWGARKLSDIAQSRSLPTAPSFPASSTTRMIAAGVIAGLLPLVHAHSFVVVMSMAACIALLQRRWRLWITFAIVASIIALPQVWWSTRGSAVKATNFFAFEVGWDHGNENIAWFWFKNTGIFIPLIFAAVLWRGQDYLISRRLLLFYLPFTLCFIVPNMVKFAPWIWDNVKILFYWWLASAPLVALLLARLWRDGPIRRALAVALFVCLTLAGALDVASIVSHSGEFQLFDPNGVKFAEVVKQQTQPRSLVIHAAVHNTPIFLTGRRSLMGYPGHIWTHGLEFSNREGEIKRIYAGAPEAPSLLRKYGVEYAVVGPLERLVMPVNQQFFTRYQKVGEVGEYRLYKITP
jgi:hypothetical protein